MALRISLGLLWSLGRPRRFGVGRSGWRSGHSASDRSLGYLLLSITESLASSLRLFQTVSQGVFPETRLALVLVVYPCWTGAQLFLFAADGYDGYATWPAGPSDTRAPSWSFTAGPA